MASSSPGPIRSIGVGTDLQDALDFDGYLGGFELAGGIVRTVSFIIDFLVVFGIPAWLNGPTSTWLNGVGCSGTPDYTGNYVTAPTDCLSHWVFPFSILVPGGGTFLLLEFVLIVLNVGWLNGHAGQSIGKAMTDLHLALPVETPTGERCFAYIGFARSIGRYIAHVLDVFTLGWGFLRGTWHPRRQTFADSVMGTVVVKGPITLNRTRGRRI